MTFRALFTFGILLVSLCWMSPMLLRTITDHVLFYPERGQWRTPEALGMPFEDLRLLAGSDRIQAWWIEGEPAAPVLVMFHGNGGTIADRLENVGELVARFGVSVLQVEYPGYGDSEGQPSEESLYAAGAAGLAEARRRALGRRIVLFGRSLGGAVAIDLAARTSVDGLVVESTFTSLAAMASASGIPLARHLMAYRFDSIEKIGRVTAPILLLHGDRDEIVPHEMASRLLQAATGTPRRALHTVLGGRHNDTWIVGARPYWQAWSNFLTAIADSPGP